MLNEVSMRLDDLKTVLDQSLNLRKTLLINSSSNIKTWFCKVKKMKGIYHTLNLFIFDQKSMIAECWIPSSEISRIKDVLHNETVCKYFLILNCFFKIGIILLPRAIF